jgi:SAM-dependent methyltransferase
MEAEQSAVAPILQAAAPTRALDVGTGTGRNVPLLAAAGARFVVGVDLSMAMLARGAGRRVCGDATRLPFADAAFDLVCSSLMAGDVEDLGAWAREASRLLAAGGHLVYSDFHPVWALQRWRRTFRASDGRQYEVKFCPHTIDDHMTALAAAGFRIRAIREPKAAGQIAPLVVIFHAVRSGTAARLER